MAKTGMVVVLIMLVGLVLSPVVYAGVSFSGSTGATVSGGGISASVGKACSGADPYVEKAVMVELNEKGETDDEDSGHLSITERTPLGEVIVSVDAELVSAWVKVGNTNHAEARAEAGIRAQGEIIVDDEGEPTGEVYVDAMLYAEAQASSEGKKTAQAKASADGSALATANSSYLGGDPEGYPRAFHDIALVEASAEGKAEVSVKAKRNGNKEPTRALAWAGLIAHSELGSRGDNMLDYSLLGSSSELVGTSVNSYVEAQGSVEGSASASGELNDFDTVIESSETSVEGKAQTKAEMKKGSWASAYAGAGSVNAILPETAIGGEVETPSLYLEGEATINNLAEASFLGAYTEGNLNIYSGYIKADASVEAETEASGSLELPDVLQSSETRAGGEEPGTKGKASSSTAITSAAMAESAAGAASVNLVDIQDGDLSLEVNYPVAEYNPETGDLIDIYPEQLLGVDLSTDWALLVDASTVGSYSYISYTTELDEFGGPTRVIINKGRAKSEVDATTSASGQSVIEDEVASSDTVASGLATSYARAKKNGEPWASSAAWVTSLSAVDAQDLEITQNGTPILPYNDYDVVTGSTIGTVAWAADNTKVKSKATLDMDIPLEEDAATSALASLEEWDPANNGIITTKASTEITTATSYSWLNAKKNKGRCTINGDLVNEGDYVISRFDRSWNAREDVNWAHGYGWGVAYTPVPW